MTSHIQSSQDPSLSLYLYFVVNASFHQTYMQLLSYFSRLCNIFVSEPLLLPSPFLSRLRATFRPSAACRQHGNPKFSEVCLRLGPSARQRLHVAWFVIFLKSSSPSTKLIIYPNISRHASRHVHRLGGRRPPALLLNGGQSKDSIHIRRWCSRPQTPLHNRLRRHHRISRLEFRV